MAASCGVGHRRGSDQALLWRRRRRAAAALIRPLAWEPPYALKKQKRKEKERKEKIALKNEEEIKSFSTNEKGEIHCR